MRKEFPASYAEARAAFRARADDVSATLHCYPLPCDRELTMDVAILRPGSSRCLVVSSGVHGVEGPLGSAIQTNWLTQESVDLLPDDVGVVLIHAINPYGFANDRRWNEDNVDLNRNFLLDNVPYSGAPEGYRKVQTLLNPTTAPSRGEPFMIKAAWQVARSGLNSLKEAIAQGQYEFPSGLFYGGKSPSASTEILKQHYRSWIPSAEEVTHLDFHSGLGKFGEHRFLLESGAHEETTKWFQARFGDHLVEPSRAEGTSYEANGTFGKWAAKTMAGTSFRFATIDFGTYGLIRVLAALRAENRMFHHARDRQSFQWVRREIRECFCPRDPKWRHRVVTAGGEIMNQCLVSMSATSGLQTDRES